MHPQAGLLSKMSTVGHDLLWVDVCGLYHVHRSIFWNAYIICQAVSLLLQIDKPLFPQLKHHPRYHP